MLLSLIGLTTHLIWPPLEMQADSPLPPREPQPTSPPNDDDDDDDGPSSPVGAYIVLQVEAVPAQAWGQVQWLGGDGNWHDVEGWQGGLPSNSRWWVAARDFNKGPFRWAVLNGPGGELLGSSFPFTLPNQANETRLVSVSLK